MSCTRFPRLELSAIAHLPIFPQGELYELHELAHLAQNELGATCATHVFPGLSYRP